MNYKHCDDYIRDKSQPMVLRKFLLVNRIPAVWKYEKWIGKGKPEPVLFGTAQIPANYGAVERKEAVSHLERAGIKEGDRVRVVMASRFGDIGITTDLKAENGYETRCPVEWLTMFSEEA